MPVNKPQIITTKQAKAQVNTLGISLIIYISLLLLLWHGSSLVARYAPQAFMGYDADLITMVFVSVMILLVAFIPFSISARKLRLPIRDYLQKPDITLGKLAALCCMGTGIMLIVLFVVSIFGNFFGTELRDYAFIGAFTSTNNIIKNIVYFVLTVLIQPVCDEYIFRGIIQRQLGHYNRYFGVLASSVLYALAQSSIADAAIAVFLGWFLALVTLRYHSIKPAIRIHIFTSFFTWLIIALPEKFVIIPTIMIVLIYIVVALSLFNRTINYRIARHGAAEPKLWKIVFTSWTIITCIILFVINNFLGLL